MSIQYLIHNLKKIAERHPEIKVTTLDEGGNPIPLSDIEYRQNKDGDLVIILQ